MLRLLPYDITSIAVEGMCVGLQHEWVTVSTARHGDQRLESALHTRLGKVRYSRHA